MKSQSATAAAAAATAAAAGVTVYDSMLEKVRQMQFASGVAPVADLGAAATTVAAAAAPTAAVTPTLQPTAAAVAAALPFLQGSPNPLAAFPGAGTPDANISQLAAAASFYHQLAALDPGVQVGAGEFPPFFNCLDNSAVVHSSRNQPCPIVFLDLLLFECIFRIFRRFFIVFSKLPFGNAES
ncbi:unnamed protein product [Gongylonema pulchrum]|uniref:Uncharacterized protein n=1 Tax=Gongylonema pulchrum TaxID=637853 RepID=A0A183DDR7_9BILA|nr:unnamed protein product [Gongylonema pulchrum]